MDCLPALQGNGDKGNVDRGSDSRTGTDLYFAFNARLANELENFPLMLQL
jgi:hypothetical protein